MITSEKKQKKIIAMAGGGTGGHVFPIRSLLETLFKTPSYASQVEKVYRFGTRGSLEEEVAKEQSQVHFQPLFSGKFRRQKTFSAFFANLRDCFLFLFGLGQSLRYLHHYHIETVFCKGGYVALPIVFAAKMLHKKLIVHESDVHPGLVNRIAARFASAVFTGFDGVLPSAITVGQILSDDIVNPSVPSGHLSRSIAGRENTELPAVFVMGGSQGSRTLYETFAQLLQTNPKIASGFTFFISLGKLNAELKSLFPQANVHVFDFLSQKEMGELYQRSDFCLVRGGTTSLAEQKLFHLKSIIVPIPRTHDQMDNAKRYVRQYDDLLLDQTSSTFFVDMEKAFLSLLHYHKPLVHGDIFAEIQQAKRLILEKILI